MLALLPPSCVTLARPLDLSAFQHSNSTCLTRWLWGLSELVLIMHSAPARGHLVHDGYGDYHSKCTRQHHGIHLYLEVPVWRAPRTVMNRILSRPLLAGREHLLNGYYVFYSDPLVLTAPPDVDSVTIPI